MANQIITNASNITSTNVSVGSGSTQILAANPARKIAVLTNLSNEVCSLGFGAAAVANKGVVLAAAGNPRDQFIIDDTRLIGTSIYGITASGSKTVAVMEATGSK